MTGEKLGPASECHKTFLNCNSKLVIFGGGAGCGKSHQALMLVLKYKDDPNYRAVFIRETSTQLTQAGGLFQEAQHMWKSLGATFKSHPQMTAKFPSGAEVQFKVCGHDRDISNYDGGQYSHVFFDEGQNHTEVQIKYLESRIRSKAKGPHQLVVTCNPRQGYLYQFVQPYLDMSTGIPMPSEFAKERWFATFQGNTVIGDSPKELFEKYGEGIRPQSYTFVAATIADNPIMKVLNPGYVDRLENLVASERQRLLLGSWHVLDTNDGIWKADWVEVVDSIPNDLQEVRSWDLASSVATEINRDPDYTCGVKMGRSKDGTYYIIDAYRFRDLPDKVLKSIIKVAYQDGLKCTVTIPRDPGSAGVIANKYYVSVLAEAGVAPKTLPPTPHSSKLDKFKPFAAISQAGKVKMLKGDWNSWYINELSVFNGGRKGHDDAVDGTSDAFNTLCKQIVMPTFSVPTLEQASPIPRL